MNPARHHRQALIGWVGEAGQARIASGSATIVGVGAVGCVAADLLARAGVGELTLIDRDVVERTNLQRQSLYTERDALEAAPKAVAASLRLSAVDPSVRVTARVADVSSSSASMLLGRPTVLLDCSDNYETRYLLNDYAVRESIPLCYAGAVSTTAMSMAVLEGRACVRCVFPEPPPLSERLTCDTAGVLGPAAAIAGALAASDAIKALCGRPDLIASSLSVIDLESGSLRTIDIASARDEGCPCCALGRFEHLEGALSPEPGRLCGRDAVQLRPVGAGSPDLGALAGRLRRHARVELTPFLVRADLHDERRPDGAPVRLTVFADGRTLIEGETRTERARALAARYLGA